jgi:hypothetical protein
MTETEAQSWRETFWKPVAVMAEVAELPAIRLYLLSSTVGDTAVPGVKVITVAPQALGVPPVAVICAPLATVLVTLDVAMPFAFVARHLRRERAGRIHGERDAPAAGDADAALSMPARGRPQRQA